MRSIPVKRKIGLRSGGSPRSAGLRLLAQPERLDDLLVLAVVLLLKIGEELTPLADHQKQAAAGMLILFMLGQMTIEVVDPLREQRDLHFNRARIFGVELEILDQPSLHLAIHRHVFASAMPPRHRFPSSFSLELVIIAQPGQTEKILSMTSLIVALVLPVSRLLVRLTIILGGKHTLFMLQYKHLS